MADKDSLRHDYDSQAGTYNEYVSLPIGVMEEQLFTAALGDCRGLTVLDLGGGTGRKQHRVFLTIIPFRHSTSVILPLFLFPVVPG